MTTSIHQETTILSPSHQYSITKLELRKRPQKSKATLVSSGSRSSLSLLPKPSHKATTGNLNTSGPVDFGDRTPGCPNVHTMSAPSLYTAMSSSPTPSSSIKAGSSASSPPIISRRGTLVTCHDFPHGRLVEFPGSPSTEMSPEKRAGRDDLRSKIWLSNDQTRISIRTARTKRLETMNLRGARQATKSVINNSHSLSRKSDSVNDSGKASSSQEALPGSSNEDRATEMPVTGSVNLREDGTLTADDAERRQNFEKCMNWIDTLPNKFSSMHIVQERAPVTHDY